MSDKTQDAVAQARRDALVSCCGNCEEECHNANGNGEALDALIAAVLAECAADTKRLDWLGNNAPFDEWHGIDIHWQSSIHAGEAYADEAAVRRAYALAIRDIIDHAMREAQP